MLDLQRLGKLLTKNGVLFDNVQRTTSQPYWMSATKQANYVLRLSSKKTEKHFSLGSLDWFEQTDHITKALSSIKSIQVVGSSLKEYYGRPGYWGARKTYVHAAVDHWTLSIYIYWKGK